MFNKANDSNPLILKKLKLEAMMLKAIRQNCNLELLAKEVAQDPYFLEMRAKFGCKIAYQAFEQLWQKTLCDPTLLLQIDRSNLYLLFESAT